MDLNLILQGWLIKSPPENKSAGPFKLFKAKWRRRWFVLYEPLASQTLPGTRAALDYYNNDRRQKKLGSIDLDHCEEVQFKLDSADYKHIFSLRTKHKGHDRTYFLSVASEAEMMKWVDCLCLALGLKENSEDVEPTQVPLNPQVGLSPLPPPPPPQQQAVVGLPPSTVTETSDNVTPVSQPQCPNGGYNSYLSHSNQKLSTQTEADLPYQKSEAYIPLVDCYTGERDSNHLRHEGKSAEYRGSNDSIPSEPPPAPPIKSGRKLSEEVQHPGDPSLYDSPTKSYINLGVDDNENVYKIPRSDGDGVYKMPCGMSPENRGTYRRPYTDHTEDWNYDLTKHDSDWADGHKACDTNDNDSDEGIYKIPRSDPVTDDDVYKVPPALPCRGSSQSSHTRPLMPAPGAVQTQRDVSVFSQVPLPLASSTLTDGVTPWRSSPDGEASPSDLQNNKNIRVPPPSVGLPNAGDLYDVPKSMSPPLGQRHCSTERVTVSGLYDTPKSCLKTAADNTLLESVVPLPGKSQPSLRADDPSLPEGRYENLQQNVFDDTSLPRRSEKLHSKTVPLSSRLTSANYYNQQPGLDTAHNIPPPEVFLKENEKMVYIPPPPRTCQSSTAHSYINTPSSHYVNEPHEDTTRVTTDSFYMPMSLRNPDPDASPVDIIGDVYTDMNNAGSQLYSKPPNNRPVNPSVHDVVPPPSKREETYVFQTQRTRSFKRPVQHNHSDVVLPTRRTGMSDDVSSSDEETSSSSSQHDKSADSISYKNYPPPPVNTTLAAKMGALNCTPPAPKQQGEIQYLDLALEEQSDKVKNSICSRTPASGNVSPTDYKEIDFVKTKALNETQKDVESKRKSSERSADE